MPCEVVPDVEEVLWKPEPGRACAGQKGGSALGGSARRR